MSSFGIIGGGALLAGVSTVGAIGTLPISSIGALATLGKSFRVNAIILMVSNSSSI